MIWAGAPFFVRGWASVINRRLNMFTLISIGVGAAFLYSLVATFLHGIGVPIAAGVLYPFTGILMFPMLGGAALALSSFTVVANALRLNRTSLSV